MSAAAPLQALLLLTSCKGLNKLLTGGLVDLPSGIIVGAL
jgi:hypothetical protein